jgi:PBP1b-binding outer membrane lipoprotein LpoB
MIRFALVALFLALLAGSFSGCSNDTTPKLPSGPMTAEQIEKVKAEDKNIADEESQGSAGK